MVQKLVAARIATDMAVETRYTLQMLGVLIDGSVLMLGDNKSVVLNTTIPSSALKKKHNAIAYHRVREAIAARIIRFCHLDTNLNVADVLTKPLGNAEFHNLVRPFLFRNPGGPRWPSVKDTEPEDASLSPDKRGVNIKMLTTFSNSRWQPWWGGLVTMCLYFVTLCKLKYEVSFTSQRLFVIFIFCSK